ncbi:MAG: hypothetical protein Q8Q09_28000 [Deltaproteobacteria bacterium]|nr:hypothetical protein [Deltaproteobacteria bacterium]
MTTDHATITAPRAAVQTHVRAWLTERARALHAKTQRTVVLGLSAPQGWGKTTLCAHIARDLQAHSLNVVTLSLDDLYLTHAAQSALRDAHPDNRYLAQRGYPGTHDLDLAHDVLCGLCALDRDQLFAVPRYDKSAHQGQGDRAPERLWPTTRGPVDVLLIEGWMLGFIQADRTPQVSKIFRDDPALAACDARLAAYQTLHAAIDGWACVRPRDVSQVLAWRVAAERARRDRGEGAMSEQDITRYIAGFLPAYSLWGAALGQGTQDPREPSLRCWISED